MTHFADREVSIVGTLNFTLVSYCISTHLFELFSVFTGHGLGYGHFQIATFGRLIIGRKVHFIEEASEIHNIESRQIELNIFFRDQERRSHRNKFTCKVKSAYGAWIVACKSNFKLWSAFKRNLEGRLSIPLKYASGEAFRFHYTSITRFRK